MPIPLLRRLFTVFAVLCLVATACGSETETAQTETDETVADSDAGTEEAEVEAEVSTEQGETEASVATLTIAVTTNILGDVVENIVGDLASVETIMPVGADPHDFQASAQEIATVMESDALIVNGASFEEGLLDMIEAAEADDVAVYEAIEGVDVIAFDEDEHDDHEDEDEHDDHEDEDEHDDHEDEDEHDDHAHDHDGDDPHFFTDPVRMATAVEGIATFLIETVDGLDSEVVQANADAYVAELDELNVEVTEALDGLSDEQRVLVTNHEVFAYFAEQYDFEVVGTVIPGGSTVEGASGQQLAELVEIIEHEGVPAIFSDVSASDELIATIAYEVGEIAIVELYTESLGEADSDGATYIDMVRTNANRISQALAS